MFGALPRRGETDIQITPISVTALDEKDLDKMLMRDIGDISASRPERARLAAVPFLSQDRVLATGCQAKAAASDLSCAVAPATLLATPSGPNIARCTKTSSTGGWW